MTLGCSELTQRDIEQSRAQTQGIRRLPGVRLIANTNSCVGPLSGAFSKFLIGAGMANKTKAKGKADRKASKAEKKGTKKAKQLEEYLRKDEKKTAKQERKAVKKANKEGSVQKLTRGYS